MITHVFWSCSSLLFCWWRRRSLFLTRQDSLGFCELHVWFWDISGLSCGYMYCKKGSWSIYVDVSFTGHVIVSVEKFAAWFRWISIAVKMQWSLLGCASCCSTLWTGLIKPLWEQKIVRHYLQEESVGTGRAVIIGSEVPLDNSRQERRQFSCRMGWKSYLNAQSGYFSALPAHLSALQSCYGKGYFLFFPPLFYSLLSASILSQNAKCSCFSPNDEKQTYPDLDII